MISGLLKLEKWDYYIKVLVISVMSESDSINANRALQNDITST